MEEANKQRVWSTQRSHALSWVSNENEGKVKHAARHKIQDKRFICTNKYVQPLQWTVQSWNRTNRWSNGGPWQSERTFRWSLPTHRVKFKSHQTSSHFHQCSRIDRLQAVTHDSILHLQKLWQLYPKTHGGVVAFETCSNNRKNTWNHHKVKRKASYKLRYACLPVIKCNTSLEAKVLWSYETFDWSSEDTIQFSLKSVEKHYLQLS